MLGAGLLAKKAREKGLHPKPWVKTSLAPGSQVVTEYLDRAGLSTELDALGFQLVGYGCTTCIGNSGPLDDEIAEAIEHNSLVAVSVLSGNRNFEGRVHPNVRANYLASPPLVVAYALLGTMNEDITTASLGDDQNGQPVYLKDIWPLQCRNPHHRPRRPRPRPIHQALRRGLRRHQGVASHRRRHLERDLPLERRQHLRAKPALFRRHHHDPRRDHRHQGCPHPRHVRRQHHHRPHQPRRQHQERQPRRRIPRPTPGHAARLQQLRRPPRQPPGHDARHLRQYPHQERNGGRGGGRLDEIPPGGEQLPIYDAAMRYKAEGVPLVVFGGKEYGMGSSRDWAAKGTALLGIRAVIVESFERIHRSNLVGMGVVRSPSRTASPATPSVSTAPS